MKAAYSRYNLNFSFPAGTSRGILAHKETYFIKIWDEETPHIYGIGECAIFRGLSAEDTPDYENKLKELCSNIINNEPTDLSEYSSIKFGLEGAILDYSNGGKRIYYHSKFTDGNDKILINGLVWMGTKEEMITRIDEKIAAGFRTIKLKVGAIDFNSELSIIDYIRCNYPPDKLDIRLDANGGFTVANVEKRLRQLSYFDIHSIEQPIMAGKWNEMAYLCANSPISIALDEELIGVNDISKMNAILNTIAPQYIILKPSLIGGIANSRHWMELAEQKGIGYWVTSALESNIGLNTIAQWVATLNPTMPQGLGTGNLFLNNIGSPLTQEKDYLSYNPMYNWDIPELNWI